MSKTHLRTLIRTSPAGFLVLPDFVTEQELDALKARANAIVDDFDPAEVAIFSTTKQVSFMEHLCKLPAALAQKLQPNAF